MTVAKHPPEGTLYVIDGLRWRLFDVLPEGDPPGVAWLTAIEGQLK